MEKENTFWRRRRKIEKEREENSWRRKKCLLQRRRKTEKEKGDKYHGEGKIVAVGRKLKALYRGLCRHKNMV